MYVGNRNSRAGRQTYHGYSFLFLTIQKQMYSLSNCFTFCNSIRYTISNQLFISFRIQSYTCTNIYRVFCFWSACFWAHKITSLLSTHKLYFMHAQKSTHIFIFFSKFLYILKISPTIALKSILRLFYFSYLSRLFRAYGKRKRRAKKKKESRLLYTSNRESIFNHHNDLYKTKSLHHFHC